MHDQWVKTIISKMERCLRWSLTTTIVYNLRKLSVSSSMAEQTFWNFVKHHWNNTQAIRILHSTFFKRELESKLRANFTQNTYFCFIPQVYQSICSSKKLSLNETSFTMYYSQFSVKKKPSAEFMTNSWEMNE